MEFLARLRPKDARHGAVASALDQVFHPGAQRAREEADRQHERVLPTPSPGDRLLDDGVVVIEPPAPS